MQYRFDLSVMIDVSPTLICSYERPDAIIYLELSSLYYEIIRGSNLLISLRLELARIQFLFHTNVRPVGTLYPMWLQVP